MALFEILYGEPDISRYFKKMVEAKKAGTISKNDEKAFKKVLKAVKLLRDNPKHPTLNTHEISELSQKAGFKVFEAYLENKTSGAGRLFWAYGPNQKQITILGIEPHPNENKRGVYKRIKLSNLPDL